MVLSKSAPEANPFATGPQKRRSKSILSDPIFVIPEIEGRLLTPAQVPDFPGVEAVELARY